VFTFLLSARLFIPPPELLARVCELCIKQQQLDQSPLDTVSTAPRTNSQLLYEYAQAKEQEHSDMVVLFFKQTTGLFYFFARLLTRHGVFFC